MELPNQKELQTLFSGFLFEAGLSAVSVKNYLSDLRHFFSFCLSISPSDDLPSVQEIFQSISKYINLYIDAQKKAFTPQNTINRRLASIRRFSTFLSAKFGLNSSLNEPLSPHKSDNFTTNSSSSNSLPTITKIVDHFKQYLLKEKKTYSTIKNYISDLNHFFAWSANETPFLDQNLENILSESHLNSYVTYLRLNHTSTSVINRRQSSIKKFSKYCFTEKYIPENPFENKLEVPKLAPLSWLERFKNKTNAPKKASNGRLATLYRKYNALPFTPYLHLAILVLVTSAFVIFGYNQIIKQATPSSAALPTVPRRQLSFQGRLTDSTGTPIVTAVNVVFKLWNALPAGTGTQLYTSGTCSITPTSPDGIFSTLIGDGTCGQEIDNTVFTNNRDVFLEITVGSETLTPRQQIATVGYALNSETLQGYPASSSATVNTIPVVDNNGDINIAASSPNINSTSGTFTVTGQALTLSTAANSGGDIILQPDAIGGGNVQILGSTTSTDTFRLENANLTSGSLISGYVGNNTATGNLLSLTSGSTETNRFLVGANGRTIVNTNGGTDSIFSASASGVTQFVISGSGNVGIGLTNPSENLDVNGKIRIRTIDDAAGDILTTSATGIVQKRTPEETRVDMGAGKDIYSVYYVDGNTSGTAGTWTGSNSDITAYYDGLTVAYKIGIAGATTTTLNINSLGAVTARRNTSGINTSFPVGTVVVLTYTTISGTPYWVTADYDTDTTESYTLRWNNSIQAGAQITRYKLIMSGTDNKWYPLTVGDTTAATKTVSSTEFLINSPILDYYTTSTIAANGTFTNIYEGLNMSYLDYTLNQSSGLTAYAPVYLVGTINANGNFVLDGAGSANNDFWTQTLPSTEDGKVYIMIGIMSNSTTTMRIMVNKPIYEYKNGKIREYSDQDLSDYVPYTGATQDLDLGSNDLIVGGNIGVGLTNPSFKLDVTGDINLTGALRSSGSAGTSGQVLSSTGTGTAWIDLPAAAAQYWQLNSGALTPANITNSLNLGATATNSATVHLAGTSGENSFVNTGNFGVGLTNPNYKLDVVGSANLSSGNTYKINGVDVLSSTTLGSGVVSSSLTSVGALASGSIASGFGTITTANTITGTTINGTTGINTGASAGTQRIDANGNLVNIGNASLGGYATVSASLAVGYTNAPAGPGSAIFRGNVGVGLTNPSYKLDVTGDINLTGALYDNGSAGTSGQILSSTGTGVQWINTSSIVGVNQGWTWNTGVLYPTNISDAVNLGNAATNSATVHLAGKSGDNSFINTGNFGIGKTNPGVALDVTGAGTFSSTLTASNGFTQTTGSLNLTSTNGSINSTGLTGLTQTLSSGTAAITAPTLNLNTASTGLTSIGNATGTFSLNSNTLDISTGGALTNAASYNGLVITANTGVITTGTWNASLIPLAYGGTNKNMTAVNGGIVWTDADSMEVSAAGTAGQVLVSNGAAAPSWTNASSISGVNQGWTWNTGVLYPTNISDAVNLGNAATNSATVHLAGTSGDNSFVNTGNFGVGTTNPATKLDVIGGDIALDNQQSLQFHTTGGALADALYTDAYDNLYIGNWRLPALSFFVQKGMASVINNLGYTSFGIGINPVGFFNVTGAAEGKALVMLNQVGGDQNILVASSSGTTRLVLSNDGHLGIGTTAPSYELDLVGDLNLTGGIRANSSFGTSGQILSSTGTGVQWINAPSGGTGDSPFTWNTGVIYPKTITDAVNLGNAATNSATVHLAGKSGDNSFVNTGNFGVGITNPTAKLQAVKDSDGNMATFTVDDVADTAGLSFYGYTSDNANTYLADSAMIYTGVSTPNLSLAANHTNGTIRFSTTGYDSTATERMRITSTGYVGIGLTNPNYKLDVSGDINLTGALRSSGSAGTSGQILASTGTGISWVNPSSLSATNQGWTWNSGVLYPTTISDAVNLGNTATNSATVHLAGTSGDNSFVNTGNFGVGLTNPTAKIQAARSTDGNIATFTSEDGDSAGLSVYGYTSDYGTAYLQDTAMIYTGISTPNLNLAANHTNGTIKFLTAGYDSTTYERMRITNTGNVGIGTTAPTAKLDVAGDATTSGSLVFRGTSPATVDVLNGDRLDFQTSPGGDAGLTAKMSVLNNGYVGIGSTSPQDLLQVGNSSSTTNQRITIDSSSAYHSGIVFRNAGTQTALISRPANTNNLSFNIMGYGDVMTMLATSGYVGIGTTTPSQMLQVGTGTGFLVNNNGAIMNANGATISGTLRLSSSSTGILHTNSSGYVSSSAVDLASSDVTGTLPLANGGTNNTSYTSGKFLAYDGSKIASTAYDSSSFQAVLTFQNGLTATGNTVELGGTNPLVKNTNVNQGSYSMTFTGTGNFGIGATTPSQKLDVGGIFVVDTTNSRVGIGTTTPTAKLEIGGSSSLISNASGDIFLNAASNFINFSGDSLNNFLNATVSGQLKLASFADTGRPVSIGSGSLIYSTTQGNPQYFNGSSWKDLTNYFSRTAYGTLYSNNWFDSINLGASSGDGATSSAKVRLSGDVANNTFFVNPIALGFTTSINQPRSGYTYALETNGGILPHTTATDSLGYTGYEWKEIHLSNDVVKGGNAVITLNNYSLTGATWHADQGLRVGDTNALTYGMTFEVVGNTNMTGTLTTGGGLVVGSGTGKIDAGTVDPPYTINGKKYATYMASMVGLKEEVTGKVTTTDTDYLEGVGYRTLIDLDQQQEGSDIWLFSKAVNIQANIENLSVLLTPEGQAKAWYEIDSQNKILAIYSSTPANVSYRLTAPRFDAENWQNTRTSASVGHVINDPDNYTNNNSIFAAAPITPELIAKVDNTYSLSVNGTENKEVSSFMTSLIANLKAGAAVVANLVTDNLTVRTKLISPIADIDQLKVIDATISGTLYADNIQGETIDNLHSQINLLDEKYSTASAILATLQAKYQGYDQLIGSISSATVSGDPLTLSPLATTSAVIPSDLALDSLNVHTIISNDVLANGTIFTSSLSSFDTDLFIQPTGEKPVHLLANLMTLYPDGIVRINGNLIVTQTIFANALDTKTATISGTLALGQNNTATDSSQLLALYGKDGSVVGSVDASGSAQFDAVTTSGLVIAAGNNSATASGSTQTNSNATIGTAAIASGTTEITIANTKVTPTTLIYVTPTSDTNGKVLYVKAKETGTGFTVAVSGGTNLTNISFNYWLVETK